MAFHGMGGGMATYVEEQKKRGRKTDSRTVRRVAQAFSPYKFCLSSSESCSLCPSLPVLLALGKPT